MHIGGGPKKRGLLGNEQRGPGLADNPHLKGLKKRTGSRSTWTKKKWELLPSTAGHIRVFIFRQRGLSRSQKERKKKNSVTKSCNSLRTKKGRDNLEETKNNHLSEKKKKSFYPHGLENHHESRSHVCSNPCNGPTSKSKKDTRVRSPIHCCHHPQTTGSPFGNHTGPRASLIRKM